MQEQLSGGRASISYGVLVRRVVRTGLAAVDTERVLARQVRGRRRVRGGRILEIGALDSPTFPERNINYLDWFSRDELMAELAENPRHTADRIVDPEYVVKDKRFAEHIDARFDVVIANHVIEHVADPHHVVAADPGRRAAR